MVHPGYEAIAHVDSDASGPRLVSLTDFKFARYRRLDWNWNAKQKGKEAEGKKQLTLQPDVAADLVPSAPAGNPEHFALA